MDFDFGFEYAEFAIANRPVYASVSGPLYLEVLKKLHNRLLTRAAQNRARVSEP